MSESLIWTLQQRLYTRIGEDAWKKGLVPSYITSNPYIAKQYAMLAINFIQDIEKELDLSEPIIFFDLGAGSARFAYLFLRFFLKMLPKKMKDTLSFRYVMTDIAESTFTYWQRHPYLKEFIEMGVLDFAYYHHNQKKGGIDLRVSGVTCKNTKNPLILIANYFFDTIPQDLFCVRGGHLYSGLLSLSVEKGDENLDDAELIQRLQCRFSFEKQEGAVYLQKELNEVLEKYCDFPDCTFLFPIAGFQSLHFFSKLSGGKLFLLAGDQGVCTKDQIIESKEPALSKHHTFSISVNYHALTSYFRHLGGMGLLTSMSDPLFVITASSLGYSREDLFGTVSAFENEVDIFEPKDYWRLVSYAEKDEKRSLEEILFLLKLGNWDPMNFHTFYERIYKGLKSASTYEKELLKKAIHLVWEHFYPISEDDGDFVMNLGVLFFEMEMFEEALLFFERSLKITGDRVLTQKNMTACLKRL